jgi:stringent starvation protein B
MTSNKPYLVKAYYDWISDNELTPYIMVDVNVYGVLVPMAYVTDGQIVLNVSGGAVGVISLGADTIEFSARFGGKLEHIVVPYGAIGAIYAKETGAGTSLPIEHPIEQEEEPKATSTPRATLTSVDNNSQKSSSSAKSKGGATLKVIK